MCLPEGETEAACKRRLAEGLELGKGANTSYYSEVSRVLGKGNYASPKDWQYSREGLKAGADGWWMILCALALAAISASAATVAGFKIYAWARRRRAAQYNIFNDGEERSPATSVEHLPQQQQQQQQQQEQQEQQEEQPPQQEDIPMARLAAISLN